MVFYFTSNVVEPPVTLFMGEDKHENEELIRWGWPEDVWFHVDKLSSAHVYLRLKKGQTLDDIPEPVLQDACQLVKANSIQGNKQNNLDVVYTRWANLHKTQSMDVGQVGFKNDKEVRKVRVEKRINEIVNRLNKTKVEEVNVNFRDRREQRDREEREEAKKRTREAKEREKEENKKKEEEKQMRSYASLMKSDNMSTNKDETGYDSDDFM
ncbi:unnamed protein product [Cyprideis torosa]|uniref:Coiled-coil domain-containing protein 25 n=1 Tax=Cyprideis torosa TaxID=163714 RepID=A0A7R8W0W5_9CRUS|nr:unnamed protein product [Cyprideis torosa]CAG0880243.1 unnamed protein product [Cyprideis torosa]